MYGRVVILGLITACLSLVIGCTPSSSEANGPQNVNHITVQQKGEGRAIIFVPGLSASPDVFDAAIASVDGSIYKVYIAGFAGQKTVGTPDAVVRPVASELAAFIKANDLQNVALVGHSMGGIVSVLVAEQTDRVSKLLIVDSVPFLPALFDPLATPESAAAGEAALRAQMDAMTDAQYLAFVRNGLVRQAISEEARDYVYTDVERSDLPTVKTAFVELMSSDYSAELGEVSAEITVLFPFDPTIGFTEDQVRAIYQAQYASHRNAKIQLIETSRHFMMLDAPEAFALALSDFLESG